MKNEYSFNDPCSCCLFLHTVSASICGPITTWSKTAAPNGCDIWGGCTVLTLITHRHTQTHIEKQR